MSKLFIFNLVNVLTVSIFAITSSQLVVDPATANQFTPTQHPAGGGETQSLVVGGDYVLERVGVEPYKVELPPPPPPPEPEPKEPVAEETPDSPDSEDSYVPPAAANPDPGSAKAYAKQLLASKGLGGNEYSCLVALWDRESGWRVDAYNASSGAQGIPQALPGNKMASAGADWETNPETQIRWGLTYIEGRYGTPCVAWGHSESHGWY